MAGIFPWYNPFNAAAWQKQQGKTTAPYGIQPPGYPNLGQDTTPSTYVQVGPNGMPIDTPVPSGLPSDLPYGQPVQTGPWNATYEAALQAYRDQAQKTGVAPQTGQGTTVAPAEPPPEQTGAPAQPGQPQPQQSQAPQQAPHTTSPFPSIVGPGGGVEQVNAQQTRATAQLVGPPRTADPNYQIALQRYHILGPDGMDPYGKWLLGLAGGQPPAGYQDPAGAAQQAAQQQVYQQQNVVSSPGFTGARPTSFGGWAWGNVPVDAIANAGFSWFEVGYPNTITNQQADYLRQKGVTPFAYINMGEQVPDMAGQTGYTGNVLRTNGDWGTQVVDVTNQSWQNWLNRRADEAYNNGMRGIKFDVAEPDVPGWSSRQRVTQSMISLLTGIKQRHPDMKIILNQGFDIALNAPAGLIDGVQTEGLFSASSYPSAYLQPWRDPFYWGPQFTKAKTLAARGIPIFVAEYADPNSQRGRDLYNAIIGVGFIPYITSENWQTRGLAPGVSW